MVFKIFSIFLIISLIFQNSDTGLLDNLNANNLLHFESTSFIRGITYNNTIIVVDEVQNLNYPELASVITRVGKNFKIIFSCDYHQSDFKQAKEKQGILDFIEIIKNMKGFDIVEFNVEDIVRSGVVKDFIINERKQQQKRV